MRRPPQVGQIGEPPGRDPTGGFSLVCPEGSPRGPSYGASRTTRSPVSTPFPGPAACVAAV